MQSVQDWFERWKRFREQFQAEVGELEQHVADRLRGKVQLPDFSEAEFAVFWREVIQPDARLNQIWEDRLSDGGFERQQTRDQEFVDFYLSDPMDLHQRAA